MWQPMDRAESVSTEAACGTGLLPCLQACMEIPYSRIWSFAESGELSPSPNKMYKFLTQLCKRTGLEMQNPF